MREEFFPYSKNNDSRSCHLIQCLFRVWKFGFNITHTYGLTETYGPSTVCAWRDEWNEQSIEEQAVLERQGRVEYPVLESLSVRNPETMEPVIQIF